MVSPKNSDYKLIYTQCYIAITQFLFLVNILHTATLFDKFMVHL